jgi:hypothetical protein
MYLFPSLSCLAGIRCHHLQEIGKSSEEDCGMRKGWAGAMSKKRGIMKKLLTLGHHSHGYEKHKSYGLLGLLTEDEAGSIWKQKYEIHKHC